MAEGGGPGDFQPSTLTRLKNNQNVQRAIGIGMRVLGAYMLFQGARHIMRRRVPTGGMLALGGLQLMSGKVPTVGPPILASTLNRIRV